MKITEEEIQKCFGEIKSLTLIQLKSFLEALYERGYDEGFLQGQTAASRKEFDSYELPN